MKGGKKKLTDNIVIEEKIVKKVKITNKTSNGTDENSKDIKS